MNSFDSHFQFTVTLYNFTCMDFLSFPKIIFPGSIVNRWCHLCRCEKLEGLSLCFCIGLCAFISIAFRFFTIWWLQGVSSSLVICFCRIFKLYCLFLSFASDILAIMNKASIFIKISLKAYNFISYFIPGWEAMLFLT